ncbi:2-oxoglutarate-dependent dioxygenase 19-like [Mercurialis annua]|uniref:2-oxoglutarate-dependent dioxygenase 19-like n=1 Tax=Mercurialis annua TaxID=3986 RepID=UPI002160A6E9|nr:2-oxoglutarate-dependent dioxygenase 19-like [Mercurialis annua]
MAEVAPLVPSLVPITKKSPKQITSIKFIAESPDLTTIPASHIFTPNSDELLSVSEPEEPIPVIDYSLLISSSSHQRTKIINDLAKACQDWGFFMVVNHGVPETLMKSMIEACKGFFDLPEEEKLDFKGKNVLDPIRSGTSFNTSVEQVFCWRDFLKVFVHPVFHSPTKPLALSEIMLEYSKEVREIARQLLKGISESLELEADYIEKTLNFDQCLQTNIANYYPPCTQPELAMGLPCHSDHGLLTILIENGVSGLQVQHKGKWVNLKITPNSFLVNTGDHLEILSNGKYKSILHRAVVNQTATRISIALAHGPSLDTIVSPAPELIDRENKKPAYIGITYQEYVQLQQSNQLHGKSCLDRVRI